MYFEYVDVAAAMAELDEVSSRKEGIATNAVEVGGVSDDEVTLGKTFPAPMAFGESD